MDEIILSYSIQAMLREKDSRERADRYAEALPREIAEHNWDRNTARNVMKRNEIVMMRGVISCGEGFGH
jgi:hypothetical protein